MGFSADTISMPGYSLDWVHTVSCTATLSFTGTTANCGTVVIGATGTTRITATMTLHRVNADGSLTRLNGWSHAVNGATLVMAETHTVTSGHTYRVTVNASVTRNGETEHVSNSIERRLG